MPIPYAPYGTMESNATRGAINLSGFAPTAAQRAAVGAGASASHPLSGFYATLADAQVDYPHAVALTDELDWAVLQGAINYLATTDNKRGMVYAPRGTYRLNRQVVRPMWVSLIGDGPMATEFRVTAVLPGPCFDFIATPFTNPNAYGEVNIADSMYFVNGNAVLGDVWAFNANNAITLREVRAIDFGGVGVQIGSYNCRIEKTILACRQGAAGSKGVLMNSGGKSNTGSNGVVLDQVWVQLAGDVGVHIRGDATGSNGIVLQGCLFDRCRIGLCVDAGGGAAPVWHVGVMGCRFEDNTERSIESTDANTVGLTVLGSFFSGTIPYHVEIGSADAKVAFNSFWSYTAAAVKLPFDARRTFVGFNSGGSLAVTPSGSLAIPLVEDGNPSRLLTQFDSYFSGLVSGKRYSAHEGPALAVARLTLSSGWGTGAAVTSLNANDSRGRFTITAGAAPFTANPTVKITFAEGAWPAAPFLRLARNGGAQPAVPLEYTSTAADATITFRGTPAAGETYTIEYSVIG